ncbi:putative phosphosugar-binding protein [Elusimicrobium simillimum]|uniref:sugar isomerase domain-containing protein n=1 Tax=Elusimicrobium simillimum TaxID=3143438 RepID=UPI003C6F9166
MKNKYLQEAVKLLQALDKDANIDESAAIVANTIEHDGIVHTFGAGHSGSVALEGFHRSGAPVQISAILDPALMFQHGAEAGTMIERQEGYVLPILASHDMRPQDCIIIISNSGRNPAGIDTAIYAKKRGLKVIVITAYGAQKASPSRHSSGKKLADYADIVIDNLAGKDEANIELYDGKKVGPLSTITGAAIINAVYFRAVELLLAKGIKTPVYSSSNAGGDDGNEVLAEKYGARVKHLKG